SFVNALAINPITPSILYAGTNSGIFKSISNGSNWSAVNSGLINTFVTALAIHSGLPSTLYAGTAGGGIFVSQNSGASWDALNTGLTNLEVWALAFTLGTSNFGPSGSRLSFAAVAVAGDSASPTVYAGNGTSTVTTNGSS